MDDLLNLLLEMNLLIVPPYQSEQARSYLQLFLEQCDLHGIPNRQVQEIYDTEQFDEEGYVNITDQVKTAIATDDDAVVSYVIGLAIDLFQKCLEMEDIDQCMQQTEFDIILNNIAAMLKMMNKKVRRRR
jgi:hypothetical protein